MLPVLMDRCLSGIMRLTTGGLCSSLPSIYFLQSRNTYILKRRTPPPLYKKCFKTPKTLRSRHYVYELVENTETTKRTKIDVFLTSYVEGIGDYGDRVNVPPIYAYYKLLLPGLAVYASPENVEKFSKMEGIEKKRTFSSQFAQQTMKILSQCVISVNMNKDVPWVIEPWHVRVAFRRGGILLPEEAIQLPKLPIKGPDLTLENKFFDILVTINNTEKVSVPCRLHHLGTPDVGEVTDLSRDYIFPEEETGETE